RIARRPAQERHDARLCVAGVDPLEARRLEVELVQGGFVDLQVVEAPHPRLDALVSTFAEEAPPHLPVVVPLPWLTDLTPHEEELLARLGVLVPEEQAEVRELLPAVPRHLREERALPVDDLVVGEREAEVL